MEKIKLKTRRSSFLADTITPVSVYLKLRDRFANSFLLESSDYHGAENSFSYICCDPIASIKVDEHRLSFYKPGETSEEREWSNLKEEINAFANAFNHEPSQKAHIESGLFGYLNYDAINEFEEIELKKLDEATPIAQYHVFRFIIAMDHFKNECFLIEAYVDRPNDLLFEEVISLVKQRNIPFYPFVTTSEKYSNKTDEEYLEMVKRGIHHCNIGDVFQVVLSRNFSISYHGDDFQVYRALRSVNPSPYLFYFDYGDFRLFGSSPEAQVVIKNGKVAIHPIAGTFKRTGNDKADSELAEKLLKDPKEDSEHVMLVDLARNDLSHSCNNVKVETYKEVQYYSHVIHLVSKVTGTVNSGSSFMDIVGETFPAGTLSGAPKIRAMEIIDEYEETPRGFYGGAVGFMDFDGNFNHAIMIRSFKSQNNMLKFQAGAGIVSQSKPESELKEVYHKVGALEKAVKMAEEL